MKYKKAHKGLYKLQHPEKYKGNPQVLIYRSTLERLLFHFLDKNPNIVEWETDGLDWNGFPTNSNFIPYFDPTTQRPRRYFYDVKALVKTKNGTLQTWITEVKSKSECSPPKKPKRVTKGFLDRYLVWKKNEAKWKAAKAYCEERGYKFQILNEEHLRGK